MTINASKYKRQIALKSFGLDKQEKLTESQVLIVGLGGLGIPVAQYLNAMGIGMLGLMDNDRVAEHNLHRQVLYSAGDVGRFKVDVALEKLKRQNPDTIIKGINNFLSKANALDIIEGYDLVIDATDNFATRYLINDACVVLGKPFVYGALHDFEGQVSVFNYKDGPTYRCLFPNKPSQGEIPNCDENGVLGILPGIIGSLQAMEAVKVLTGIGEVLTGKLLLYDGLTQQTRTIQFPSNAEQKRITELREVYDDSTCPSHLIVDARSFLDNKGKKQLIDVRSQKEFEEFHIEDALNIPLPDLEKRLQQIDFDKTVYVICQSGKRSGIAARKLAQIHSRGTIYSIAGGMDQMADVCP